ncbi:hypothetical protein EBS02_12110, partial [bacterium]|nr:hypothetical protein [bacterium]
EKMVKQAINLLDPNHKYSDVYEVKRCWGGVKIHLRGDRMVKVIKLDQSFGLCGYRSNRWDYIRESTWGPSKMKDARNTIPSLAKALREPFERALRWQVQEEELGGM